MTSQAVIHLSIPARDLDETVRFYVDVLGCRLGRVRDDWVDVWCFGMQLTLQLRPDEVRPPDEQGVLHFGVAFSDAAKYLELVERLSANGVTWLSEPAAHSATTLSGKVGGKVADPSGNVIEIKFYDDRAAYRAGDAP